MHLAAEAAVLLAEASAGPAFEAARSAIDEALRGGLGVAHEAVRLAFPVALEAALDLGDLDQADRLADLLASRPPGEVPPFLRAQVVRARALITAARGEDDDVEQDLAGVEATLRELGYPYWTARAQLDRAEWLAGQDRPDESARLAEKAAATFETIGSAPMLARARACVAPEPGRAIGAVLQVRS